MQEQEHSSRHRYLQTNPLLWPLLFCPLKRCACCSPTAPLLILLVFSCQWFPASALQVCHLSFCFLIHPVLVFLSILVLHHASLPFLRSQHSDPGYFLSFSVSLVPLPSLYIHVQDVLASSDLFLCLPRSHNPSLLSCVPYNFCLAFYADSSSLWWRSCFQASLFSQYLLLPPTPIWFLGTASLSH